MATKKKAAKKAPKRKAAAQPKPKAAPPSSAAGKAPTADLASLAKLFNLTAARLQQLAKDGVIIRAARGRYDLWPSIRNYIKFLQERRLNQWEEKDENQTDLRREQLRRTKEEADKLALQNARARGELVEISAVKKLGEKVMVAMRNRILAMPLTDEEKDKCLLEILALEEIDWSRTS